MIILLDFGEATAEGSVAESNISSNVYCMYM